MTPAPRRFAPQRSRPLLLLGAFLLAPSAVVVSLRLGHDPVRARGEQPLTHREGGFVGSAACQTCHPDHHGSWSRTYHSTMTQLASSRTVLGRFDGQEVRLYGGKVRPYESDGRYYLELTRPDGQQRVAEVAMTVGSHRYQQYFEAESRPGGTVYRRLPALWHMADVDGGRWLHVGGIFFDPDKPLADPEQRAAAWPAHPAIWNENCIFCHNTAPRPGMLNYEARPTDAEKRFDSKVGDLGIACESCHGPGADHVTAMGNPAARYGAYLGGSADLHIVHPAKLDAERAVSACGQCHGQRLPKPPESLGEVLASGPPFRSGDRLEDHVTLLSRETELPGLAEPFAQRFWQDGTPRLTAYEYQGVVASPCYTEGVGDRRLTCGSCHSMHSGDVDGMIEPPMRTNQACLQCHTEVARDVAAHTKHRPTSSGSQCMECHMPHIVYGVLGVRLSHRIENPDPTRDGAKERPNACTLCHLDKSLSWAARHTQQWFGSGGGAASAADQPELPHAIESILAGDPVQRAVYARALGRSDAAPGERAEGYVALLASLGDSYGSVRHLARRSLLARPETAGLGLRAGLRRFDSMGFTPGERGESVQRLLAGFADAAPREFAPPAAGTILDGQLRPILPAIVRLLDRQSTKVISVGE